MVLRRSWLPQPPHPLAQALESDPAVAAFVAECRRMGTSEEDLDVIGFAVDGN